MTKNRRASIKQAAQSEFSRLGFAGARISRIASAAGANKQLIFYYFGSKEKLYKLLVEEAVSEIIAAVEESSHAVDPTEAIRVTFRNLIRLSSSRPEVFQFLFHALAEPDPIRARPPMNKLLDQIAGLVSDAQGTGRFRDDIDPRHSSHVIGAVLLGYFALQPVTGDQSETEQAAWERHALDLIDRWLRW